jgi:hypothetical protein
MKRAIGILAIAIAAPAFAAACGSREHMRKDHGRARAEFDQRQRIAAEPAQGAAIGLDSEEAGIILKTYRKTIGEKDAGGPKEAPPRVLILEEPKDASRK